MTDAEHSFWPDTESPETETQEERDGRQRLDDSTDPGLPLPADEKPGEHFNGEDSPD